MYNLKRLFRTPYVLWWMPIAAALAFFWPILFSGKLIFLDNGFSFVRQEDLPIHLWFAKAFKEGHWRINPLYYGGIASYLSQMDLLHPITLLLNKILSPLRAYHLLIALGWLGQWYGFYLFSRKLKISSLAAFFASFVWAFNQWVIQMGNMPAFGMFFASVPFLFFFVVKISESRHKYWYALLASIVLAPNWVFSLTQMTLYLSTALILFATYLDFQAVRFRFSKYKNTILWLIVILLSVAIVFPFIKADYALFSLGWRSQGYSYQKSIQDYYNIFDLIHFISPFTVLPFINTAYIHFYMGILPLLLFALTWKIRDNHYVKFFRWLAILALLTAIKYSPIFYILTKTPIYGMFHGSGKFTFLATFSIAVLAGFGLDMLRQSEGLKLFSRIARFYKKFLIVLASILVVINLIYYFAFDALFKLGFKIFMRYGYAHTLQKEPSYYVGKVKELLSSWHYQFSFSNIEVWLVIITLILTGIIIYLLQKNRVSFAMFSILAVILTYFSSFFIWHRSYSFVSASVLNPTPAIEYLMSHNDDQYRTITFFLGIEIYKKLGLDYDNPEKLYKFEVATLTTDVFMHYNIETLNGHDGFTTIRQNFMDTFRGQSTQTLTIEEKRKAFEAQIDMLSMMNVKYILTSVPLAKPFIKRVESTITDTQIPLYVYENPKVLPRIYFAKTVLYAKEKQPDNNLRQKLWEIGDFKNKTLIECNDCRKMAPSGEGTISFESNYPDEMVLNVKNTTDSWLVFSISFWPGWHAFVDGNEVKIHPANYLFQAIPVSVGTHKIVFKYDIL